MSDCVIALECASEDDSLRVRQVIEDRWDEFEESYGGSCAPYVTLKALRDLLGRFGFPSELGGGSPMPDGDATTSQVAVTRSPILLEGLHEAPYPSEVRRGLDEDEGGVPVGDRPEAAPR